MEKKRERDGWSAAESQRTGGLWENARKEERCADELFKARNSTALRRAPRGALIGGAGGGGRMVARCHELTAAGAHAASLLRTTETRGLTGAEPRSLWKRVQSVAWGDVCTREPERRCIGVHVP